MKKSTRRRLNQATRRRRATEEADLGGIKRAIDMLEEMEGGVAQMGNNLSRARAAVKQSGWREGTQGLQRLVQAVEKIERGIGQWLAQAERKV